MITTLKTRLARGERVNVFAVSRLYHHNFVQVLGQRGGFQGFWIDHEHAGLSIHEFETATMAGRCQGLDSFVRIAPTDYASVTRCLESGAGGVMAAQVHTADQAEEFVQWAKYMPRGCRGLNTGGYDAGFGARSVTEHIAKANQELFVAIQVETTGAVEACDAIAAIDGVDLLFVGPVDLSLALGVPGEFLHEKCLAAIDQVAAACRRHGKTWGAVTPTAEHAAMLAEKGCSMFSAVNDVRLLNAGLAKMRDDFAFLFELADQ